MKTMSGGLLVGLTAFQSSCASSADTRAGKARPNIIFILADDLGWADVGYHDSQIKTPNIDKLAKTGLSCSIWPTILMKPMIWRVNSRNGSPGFWPGFIISPGKTAIA